MHITVAVDLRESTDHVVEAAVHWGARMGAQVDLVYSAPAFEGDTPARETERIEHRLRALERLMQKVPEPMRGETRLLSGRPLDTLPTAAQDLLVVTTHGRTGLSRLWLGSVAERVIATATTPVLVLPHEGELPETGAIKVVAPTDFSRQSARMFDAMPNLGEHELHLVHVLPPPLYVYGSTEAIEPTMLSPEDLQAEELECRSALESWAQERKIEPVVHVRRAMDGSTGHAVQQVAEELGAELIALPTTGRTSLAKLLLGSVAARVVRASPVPVLVFPQGALPE